MDMEMLTVDPKRMTSHAFDRNADPEWAALADYLREAAAAGAVVRLTARPETLTPAQAAARLGMSRSTIARRIKSGEITAVRVGTHYRIPAREFERFRDAVMGAMISDVSADLEADLYGQ
jgi:excisionase family DNA binding protein